MCSIHLVTVEGIARRIRDLHLVAKEKEGLFEGHTAFPLTAE